SLLGSVAKFEKIQTRLQNIVIV
ncbi:hypothetical protein IKG_06017, partial [Bacillus cereus VD200]